MRQQLPAAPTLVLDGHGARGGEGGVMEPWSRPCRGAGLLELPLRETQAWAVPPRQGLCDTRWPTRRRCSCTQPLPEGTPIPTPQSCTAGPAQLETRRRGCGGNAIPRMWERTGGGFDQTTCWTLWHLDLPLTKRHPAQTVWLERCCYNVTSKSGIVPSMTATMTGKGSTVGPILRPLSSRPPLSQRSVWLHVRLMPFPHSVLCLRALSRVPSAASPQCHRQCLTLRNACVGERGMPVIRV